MLLRLMTLTSTILLTGCMATSYYAPSGDDVATIKFVNQGRGNADVYIYQGAEFCTGKQDAGTVDRLSSHTVSVVGNQPQSFSFGYGFTDYSGTKSCAITATFTPESQRDYEVLIVSSYGGCVAYLYELEQGQKREISGKQREYAKPYTNDNWCE